MDSLRDARRLRARRLFSIMAGSVAFAYLPTLYLHLSNVWSRTYYQFVPVLLAIAAGLIWFRLKKDQKKNSSRLPIRVPETALLLTAIVVLVASILLSAPWLGAFSAILAIGSLLLHLGGRRRLSALFPIWLLLWLILPPPFGFDVQLVAALQSFTTQQASIILDAMRIDHMMVGNVLEFPGRRLMVEEACSGVHSLFALFAYAAVFVVWRGIPLLRGLFVVASSVFWAGALNVVRVLIIAWTADRYGLDLSSGWYHELLGLCIFVVALLLIASTDEWLQFCVKSLTLPISLLFNEIRILKKLAYTFQKYQATRAERRFKVEKITGWAAWRSPIFAILFIALGCFQIILLSGRKIGAAEPVAAQNVADFLPDLLGNWAQTDYTVEVRDTSSIYGNYSGVWTYDAPRAPVKASLDYPFQSWHDLRSCYRAQGWTIAGTEQLDIPVEGMQEEQPVLVTQLSRADGLFGYLVFGEFNQRGEGVDPVVAAESSSAYFVNGLKNRWRKSLQRFGEVEKIYQFQFFVVSDLALTESEQQELQQNYRSAFAAVRANTIQEEK